MHFCQDELMAILSVLPFFGFAWAWIRTKLLRKPTAALVRCETRPKCDGHPAHHHEPEPAQKPSGDPYRQAAALDQEEKARRHLVAALRADGDDEGADQMEDPAFFRRILGLDRPSKE